MAKNKQVQVIEIDVLSKGLSNSVKDFEAMAENVGELGRSSKKVLKEIDKAQKIIGAFGDEMPVDQAKELRDILKKIASYSDDIANLKMAKVVTEEDTNQLKKYEQNMSNLKKKIEELNKVQTKSEYKKGLIKDLQSQKWISKTKDGKTERYNLDSIKGWKNEKDLENITNDSTRSIKDQKAAALMLEKLRNETSKYGEELQKKQAELEKYIKLLEQEETQYKELLGSLRTVTDAEKSRGETLSIFAEKQSDNISKVIKANQELGNNTIATTKAIDKQSVSIGGAVKALFSFAAAWNIGKRILQESIRTIQEMDSSLNGMAMVTGKTRDEVDQLIPRIQSLAKETSTAMTEVAGLITEYTKQGRTLEESFILAEETAKAAKIAGISAAESIQYMTSAINGFNLAASDATHVSDVFANIAAISATDYEQLAIALSKVSAQANLAGMSMEYTTALLAKGIETTQEAPESIGTALKTIIARMRELTDYGKTLEDGASVNKVENALAAAGIELRNVNGEFRDLETIFNELGPKWDSLNTMQRQAIAQAVAGTRQQSRFVAIMQDWERTQELATEAQDSAGASAAQYAVYAESMEAAMTNMKTSWQEFVQSLTESKTLIGLIKIGSNILEGAANAISALDAKGLTTGLIIALTVFGGINNAAEKLKKTKESELEIQRNSLEEKKKELKLQEEELTLRKKLLEQKIRELEISLESKKNQNKDLGEAFKKSSNNINKEIGSIDNEMMQYQGVSLSSEEMNHLHELEARRDALHQKRLVQEAEYNQSLNEQQLMETTLIDYRKQHESIDKALSDNAIDQITNQKEVSKAYSAINKNLIDQNKEAIKKLKLQKQEIANQKVILKNQLAMTKDEKSKIELQNTITELENDEVEINKKINNLTEHNNELSQRTAGIFDSMRSSITGAVTSGLKKMLSSLGPIGSAAGDILEKFIKWSAQRLFMSKLEKQALETERQKIALQTIGLSLDGARALIGLNINELSDEEVTNKAAELGINTAGLTIDEVRLLLSKKQAAADGVVAKQKNKGFLANVKNAIAAIAESAGMPYGTSMAFAIAGAAVLATVGIGGLLGAIGSGKGAKTDKQLEQDISKKQLNTYKLKKKNKELKSSVEEIEDLSGKKIRTAEEDEKLEELVNTLREQNDAWENLPDDQVLIAAKKELQNNTDQIKANVESAYQLALQMEDLTTAVAKQAVSDKMIMDQENLTVSPYGNLEQAKQDAAAMAKVYVDQNAEVISDSLKHAEYSDWDIGWEAGSGVMDMFGLGGVSNVADAIMTWSNGEGFWKGMDQMFLGGAVGELSDIWQDESKGFFGKAWSSLLSLTDISGSTISGINQFVNASDMSEENDEAEQERKNADETIKRVNNEIMEFASRMSESNDSVYDQLLQYQNLTEQYSDITQAVISAHYSTLDLLNQATGESSEVANNLKLLGEAGLLSSESLLGIVDEINSATIDSNKKVTNAIDVETSGFKVNDKQYDLSGLREELELTDDATIAEISAKYYAKYIETDEDGKLQLQGSDGDLEIYNKLSEIAGTLGDYANYTKEQLVILQEYNNKLDPADMVSTLLNNVTKELNLSEEDGSLDVYRNNKDLQVEGARIIYTQGIKMITDALAPTKEYIEQQEKILADKRKAYDEATDEEKEKLSQEINDIRTTLSPLKKEYEESLTSLTDATLKAAGFLSSLDADEKWKRTFTSKEKAVSLRDKMQNGEELSQEDIAYIGRDLAPLLRNLDENFNLNNFIKRLEEGNASAIQELSNLIKNMGEATSIEFAKSVELYRINYKQAEAIVNQLNAKKANGIKLTEQEEKTLAENLIKMQSISDEMVVQQYYANNIANSLNKIVISLKEEVELRKWSAKLAGLELEKDNESLNVLRQMLIVRSKMAGISEGQLDSKIAELAKKTGLTVESVESLLKSFNGNLYLDPALYGDTAKSILGDNYEEVVRLFEQFVEDNSELYKTIYEMKDLEYLSEYELGLQNARSELASFEADHQDMNEEELKQWIQYNQNIVDILSDRVKQELKLLGNLKDENGNLIDENLTETAVKDNIKIINGKIQVNEKWYNSLSKQGKAFVTSFIENNKGLVSEIGEIINTTNGKIQESFEDHLNKQIEAQDKLIELYKNKLKEEQDALKESLDKRKEMYDKYFDALEEEESDEDFEDKQAKLQRAIASLATASDAASLAKRKEYEQQLADLEKEQLSTERDRRRENLMASLDNESEMVDDYYEELLSDNRKLWEDITKMSQSEITELITIYNDEWKNATDLKRAQLEKDNESFYDSIESLLGVSITGFGTKYTELETEWNNSVGFNITPITTNLSNLENVAYEVIDNIKDEIATITLTTTPPPPKQQKPQYGEKITAVGDFERGGGAPSSTVTNSTYETSSISQIQKFVKDNFNDHNSLDSMKTAVYANNSQHGLPSSKWHEVVEEAWNKELKNSDKPEEKIKEAVNKHKYTYDLEGVLKSTDLQNIKSKYSLDDQTYKDYVLKALGTRKTGTISSNLLRLDTSYEKDGFAKYNKEWYESKYITKDGSSYFILSPRSKGMSTERLANNRPSSEALTWLQENAAANKGHLALYNDELYMWDGEWWKIHSTGHSANEFNLGAQALIKFMKGKLNGYSKGGYVDYTGLAMVHGSPNNPEAFLNASQTAMFADLAANLQAIYSRPTNYTDGYNSSSEVTIENLTIAVDAELTNENIPEIGQSLADALFDGIRRSGYSINTKK